METCCTITMPDRRHAGIALAQKLKTYRENSLVTAVSKGGVMVAQPIASMLHTSLEVAPCKRINHPADEAKTIGAVCLKNVMIYSHSRDLPQDYIQHQVHVLQHELEREMNYYQEHWDAISVEGKNVILVDDLMITGNTMMACALEIRNRNPRAIIVATPFISAEAHFFLEEFADDIVYIRMETEITSPHDFYNTFSAVSRQEVKALLKNSKRCRLTC